MARFSILDKRGLFCLILLFISFSTQATIIDAVRPYYAYVVWSIRAVAGVGLLSYIVRNIVADYNHKHLQERFLEMQKNIEAYEDVIKKSFPGQFGFPNPPTAPSSSFAGGQSLQQGPSSSNSRIMSLARAVGNVESLEAKEELSVSTPLQGLSDRLVQLSMNDCELSALESQLTRYQDQLDALRAKLRQAQLRGGQSSSSLTLMPQLPIQPVEGSPEVKQEGSAQDAPITEGSSRSLSTLTSGSVRSVGTSDVLEQSDLNVSGNGVVAATQELGTSRALLSAVGMPGVQSSSVSSLSQRLPRRTAQPTESFSLSRDELLSPATMRNLLFNEQEVKDDQNITYRVGVSVTSPALLTVSSRPSIELSRSVLPSSRSFIPFQVPMQNLQRVAMCSGLAPYVAANIALASLLPIQAVSSRRPSS